MPALQNTSKSNKISVFFTPKKHKNDRLIIYQVPVSRVPCSRVPVFPCPMSRHSPECRIGCCDNPDRMNPLPDIPWPCQMSVSHTAILYSRVHKKTRKIENETQQIWAGNFIVRDGKFSFFLLSYDFLAVLSIWIKQCKKLHSGTKKCFFIRIISS